MEDSSRSGSNHHEFKHTQGRNSPLLTGSSSLSTTKRFLTRLGHHLQEILEPYPTLQGFQMVANQKCISCHQGQEEGVHEPDIPPTKERSGQDQQVLAMVHETINAPVNHTSSDIDPILSVNRLSGVPITPPLISVMSCLQGRAILLTPTLPLMEIHQTSLNRISCGVSQSAKTTHRSTLIPHLWQLSQWII